MFGAPIDEKTEKQIDLLPCPDFRVIPVEILREAGDNGGDFMGYWAKGHWPRYEFAQKCNHEYGHTDDRHCRFVYADKCRHEVWRCVPIAGEPGNFQFVPAVAGSRGSFKVTVFDTPFPHPRAAASWLAHMDKRLKDEQDKYWKLYGEYSAYRERTADAAAAIINGEANG